MYLCFAYIAFFQDLFKRQSSTFVSLDIMRCRQSGSAAVGRRENNLIGIFLAQVTNGKDTGKSRLAFFIGDNIATGIQFDPGGNNLIVWPEADKDKNTVRFD